MHHIEKILRIKSDRPDDLFITCASFEDRCLGALRKADSNLCDNVVVFKFDEDNRAREKNLAEIELTLSKWELERGHQEILVKHGMTMDGILQFHNYCKANKMFSMTSPAPAITIDVTTFTKELLFEILFYLNHILKIEKLRLLYTVPQKYALPDEGPLSYGIKNIKVIPFFWSNWSATKDDLLLVVLGYEEMRAWSLISRFDANINIIAVTKPGSKPEWDTHCENFNKRLLVENCDSFNIPAMDPYAVITILENNIINKGLHEKYNVFIAPLGTKPQILGIFYFLKKYPEARINVISTTAIEHNIPYYSWGIGETYCMSDEELVSISGTSATP